MSPRARVLAFVAVVVAIAVAATSYVLVERREVSAERAAEPEAEQAPIAEVTDGPRIVFRHTGTDNEYGVVAVVPLDDPAGPRAFTGVSCDRVAARPDGASCLLTDPGIAATYEGVELDADWQEVATHDLPGLPSRTRLSPDGTLVATTVFVAGHSYMSTGFSTATEVHEFGEGERWGNLEKFQLVVDGREVNPLDRNVWGSPSSTTRRSTPRSRPVVVRGWSRATSRGARSPRCRPTPSARRCLPTGAASPSRSTSTPDAASCGRSPSRTLTTGDRTLLQSGPRGLDDQVEWLDDDTLIYGLPRADEPGVTDTWAVDTTAEATPRLLIEQAWSATVVR